MKHFGVICLCLGMSASSSGAIGNFGTINDYAYRGAYLERGDKDFTDLQQLGVSSIINLDFLHVDDSELCDKYTMNCQRFPLILLPWKENDFDYDHLKLAFGTVLQKQREEEKVYIHCYHGSDRTGALAAALTIRAKVCGNDSYDREKLKEEVTTDLIKHKFHQRMFPRLFAKIIEWTQKTPEWICQ